MATDFKIPVSHQERAIFRGDAFVLYGGRVAAVVSIATFLVFYVLTVRVLGIWAGVAIGWLPCAILAWVAANMAAPISTRMLRTGAHTWKTLRAYAKRTRPIH